MIRTDHLHSLLKTHMEFTQILRDRANIAEHPIIRLMNSQILHKVKRPLMDIVKPQQLLIRMRISRTLPLVESIRRNIKTKANKLAPLRSLRPIDKYTFITTLQFTPQTIRLEYPLGTYRYKHGFSLYNIVFFLFACIYTAFSIYSLSHNDMSHDCLYPLPFSSKDALNDSR